MVSSHDDDRKSCVWLAFQSRQTTSLLWAVTLRMGAAGGIALMSHSLMLPSPLQLATMLSFSSLHATSRLAAPGNHDHGLAAGVSRLHVHGKHSTESSVLKCARRGVGREEHDSWRYIGVGALLLVVHACAALLGTDTACDGTCTQHPAVTHHQQCQRRPCAVDLAVQLAER